MDFVMHMKEGSLCESDQYITSLLLGLSEDIAHFLTLPLCPQVCSELQQTTQTESCNCDRRQD